MASTPEPFPPLFSPRGAIRVLLVTPTDRKPQSWWKMIEERHDLEVVAQAANGPQAVSAARALRPDVILLDGDHTTEVLEEILGVPAAPVLVEEAPKPVDPAARRAERLTPREREVVALVGEGLKNKVIAQRMGLSESTVRHHLTSIFDKLGVTDRLELVIQAFKLGLVQLP